MDKRIKEAAEKWLPDNINAIPLHVWDPSVNGGAEDILVLSDARSPA